ncbi:MAG: hypothetical protein IKL48_00350 [Elusimicrobiaceae bacterium]|nr:hypothetical protein [Elusimicrobiaceae bacterium]
MKKVKGVLLLICSIAAILLALTFYSRRSTIEVEMPLLTKSMVDERLKEMEKSEKRRQTAQEAHRRAELEERLISCQTDEDCIIVDKDPCGCLKGPEGVTAINATMTMEFSKMMESLFAKATSCPSVGSSERECSATARPACVKNSCKIVY